MSGQQISVQMSAELVDALDREAFRQDLPRSALIRVVVADHLREIGAMKLTDPTTSSQGVNNRFFRPRRGRS